MSDDTIRLIQSLIDSKKGDVVRLQHMYDTLQQGKFLDVSDQNYLQEVSGESQEQSKIDTTVVSDLSENESTNKQEEPLGTIVSPKDETPQENLNEDAETNKIRNTYSRKKIVIASIVIAAIVVAYIGLDSYAASTLQFRPNNGNQYQISPTEIHIQADVCNPSFFPTSFNKYEITAFYNSDIIEKAEFGGNMLSSKTMSTVDGVFALNTSTLFKLKQANATFDPTLAKITTTIDAPIFGVIPFSVVKQYSAAQFQDVLKNGPPGSFSCG
ncbi:MAG: hypothetical protein KGH89_08740 [Thaumarchaeota archaeon]|nr:hypothetical protein [Nitrososphaerota archaeon]